MKRLFFGLNITWARLIAASIASGVIVGLLNCVPVLEGTSFTAPAVYGEFWLMAGLLLSCNAKSAKDAMAKVFVFFLISQPLIYLVEVPFKAAGFGLFAYYPRWAVATVLTIPLAWIAFQIRKQNLIGTVAACVAVAALAYMGAYYIPTVIDRFPNMLLAMLFCFGSAICVLLVMIPKTAVRAIASAIACVVLVASLVGIYVISPRLSSVVYMLGGGHEWQVVDAGNAPGDVTIRDGSVLVVSGSGVASGSFIVTVSNEIGETVQLQVDLDGSYADINPLN